jgi:hypothetical protein
LASRLDLRVETALEPLATRSIGRPSGGGAADLHGGLAARLRGRHDVDLTIRPQRATASPGTTLRVELLCDRRSSELRVEVTAEVETVRVHVVRDGDPVLDRSFRARRKTAVELLMEALEESGRDTVTSDAIRVASLLAGFARA